MDTSNKPYLDLWLWGGMDFSVDPFFGASIFVLAACAGVAALRRQPWAIRVLFTISVLLLPICLAHFRLLAHMRQSPDPSLTFRICGLCALCAATVASGLIRRSYAKTG